MFPEHHIPATSIVALFDTDKEQRKSFADSIVNEIMEGNKNALDIHVQLKMIESLLKDINDRPEYKTALLEEAQKHGKSFTFHSAKVEVKEVGTKYDYSQCNDHELVMLENIAKEWTDKVKARQELLKKVPVEGLKQLDEATGEIYYSYPPSKSSTTSVAVTLR